jgi:hypothetical protein
MAPETQLARRVFLTIAAAALLNIGCSEMIRRQALGEVASALGESRAGVAARLSQAANPKGSGVLVYARSATSCAAEYVWLIDGERRFALDDASLSLTPQFQSLKKASSETQKSVGFDPNTFEHEIRSYICTLPMHGETKGA